MDDKTRETLTKQAAFLALPCALMSDEEFEFFLECLKESRKTLFYETSKGRRVKHPSALF